MRVLSIIHYPVFGGPHNRNSIVIPLLERVGVETTMLLPDEQGNAAERLRNAGVDVIQLPIDRLRLSRNPMVYARFFANLWPNVRQIRRLIRERRIDVVQVNGLVNPHGAIAGHLENVAVVWQLLDTVPMAARRVVMPLVKRIADVVMSTGLKVAQVHPGAVEFGDRLIFFFHRLTFRSFNLIQQSEPRPEWNSDCQIAIS